MCSAWQYINMHHLPVEIKNIPVTEINDQIMEDLRVHVLAELHQDEPVSEPELVHDQSHVFSPAGLGAATEHQIPGISEQLN